MAQVDALVAATLQTFHGVDILVNNAGIVRAADFLDMTEADFDEVIRVNLKGMFLVGPHVAGCCCFQIYKARMIHSHRAAACCPRTGLSMACCALKVCCHACAVRPGGGAADEGAEPGPGGPGRCHYQHVVCQRHHRHPIHRRLQLFQRRR
jgi:short chain dehydrogenase